MSIHWAQSNTYSDTRVAERDWDGAALRTVSAFGGGGGGGGAAAAPFSSKLGLVPL